MLYSDGKPNLFNATFFDRPKHIKNFNKTTINDLYIREWNAKIQDSSKRKNYSAYKKEIGLERYLLDLCYKFCFPLCRFQTDNHRLPVETGRCANIPLDERKCTVCDQDIRDEYHYLFSCPYFANGRMKYLKFYFYKRPDIMKFIEIMSSRKRQILIKLSQFVDIIMKTFASNI